jgi:hypothetical protein
MSRLRVRARDLKIKKDVGVDLRTKDKVIEGESSTERKEVALM